VSGAPERPAVLVRDAAHTVIARQVREIRRQETLVLRGGAPDAIHDMRVATRRLRAALAVFRDVAVLPKAGRRRRRRRLRWLARQLGRVRDLDVRTALLAGQYLPRVAGEEAARVGGLLARLAERRAAAYRRLRRGLRRRRYRRLRVVLGGWVRSPECGGAADEGAARFMMDAVDRAALRVDGHDAMRDARPSGEALHDLRIAVKWLRYALDFHAEACGPADPAELALARELQDCLGDLRDHDLLLAALSEDGDDGRPWPQLTAAVEQGRRKLWRRFLQLRRRWRVLTQPPRTVAPIEQPRFVSLDAAPVLRLVG